MTKSTTLAVPYVTPQLFANAVITAMQKLQKASKSFLTTQGPENEIRADKTYYSFLLSSCFINKLCVKFSSWILTTVQSLMLSKRPVQTRYVYEWQLQ